MTKQIFPFYFLLQERAKPILPPHPLPPRTNLNPLHPSLNPHPPPTHPPIPHKKWFKDLFHIYYIDIVTKIMPHKSVDVICQCGAILNVYYMPKHLKTAKHARDIIGREHIEIVDHYKYQPTCVCTQGTKHSPHHT